MNKPRLSLSSLFLAGMLFAASCATSPIAKYPNFTNRKPQIAKLHILTDVSVVQDIMGETNRVDLSENKEMGQLLMRQFADGLRAKGYRVTDTVLLSLGAALDPAVSFKVRETDADKKLAGSQLPRRNPPFYMDESFAGSDSAKSDLLSLCWALQAHQGTKGANTIPTDFGFLPHDSGDVVAVMLVRGTFVPVGKQFGEALLTGLLTGGLVSVWQVSALSVRMFIVDPSNGEILWSDSAYEQGSALRVNRKHVIQRMADGMIKKLP